MMNAIGHTPTGKRHEFTGRTTSELERKADELGLIAYEYAVDGGKDRIRKIGNDWIVM